MPQYKNGLPKPNGATDWMDSAHLIGVLTFIGADLNVATVNSYVNELGYAMRCPVDNESDLQPSNYKNFTRDQFIPFIAALHRLRQYGTMRKVLSHVGFRMWNTDKDAVGTKKKFPDGPDILDPSHHGYIRILKGEKPRCFQKAWMIARIYINGWFTSLKEPNNIIIMSYYYGYLDLLKKRNKNLRQAIFDYWGGWRDENGIAEALSKKIGVCTEILE